MCATSAGAVGGHALEFLYAVIRAASRADGGNVMLLKHASNVPQCALMSKRFPARGIPEGVFQTRHGSQQGTACSTIRAWRRHANGSEGAACSRRAMQASEESLLELGGRDPSSSCPAPIGGGRGNRGKLPQKTASPASTQRSLLPRCGESAPFCQDMGRARGSHFMRRPPGTDGTRTEGGTGQGRKRLSRRAILTEDDRSKTRLFLCAHTVMSSIRGLSA